MPTSIRRLTPTAFVADVGRSIALKRAGGE
jgi:hypothetical protein